MSKQNNHVEQQVRAVDIYRYFMRVTFSFPWQASANLILAPTTILVERYLAPLIIAKILNDIQQGSITIDSALWLLIAYAAIQVYAQVIGYRLHLYFMWTVQVKGAKKIYDEAYEKLTARSLGFFNDNFIGGLVSQVNKTISAYLTFWNLVSYKILFILTSIVATIVGLYFIMWQFAVVMAILVVIFMLIAIYGMRFMRIRFEERSKSYTKLTGALSDSLTNIFTVKMDGMEASEIHKFQQHTQYMLKTELHARSGFVAISSLYSFIISLMRIGALVASVAAIQYGALNAGLVYICLTYTFNLIEEIWNFNDIIRDHHQMTGDTRELYAIMQQPQEVIDQSDRKLDVKKGEITITSMRFLHEGDTNELFADFNLTIPAGQKIGVVGVSGSGKTTLTKLLLRFMDIDGGKISIDSQDISRVTQVSLHKAIGYVPQEPLLFHRTIAENIGYSKPDASKKDITAAAKKAHAHDFIKSLPDAYDTLVGERGVKLSGGQRQRVAIARAILKNTPVLILDEATSALDSESELLIQQAIENLWENKTAIVIAHRLSTIAKLDRIIVLNKGKIVEDGTHTGLLKKKGTYAKLWSHQSGGFIEE